MIGLSLSRCIKDIIEGQVKFEDVDLLICGTNAATPGQYCYVLTMNCETCWRNDPHKAWDIARELWQQGKVIQPRTVGAKAPDITNGWWVVDVGDRFVQVKDPSGLRSKTRA